MKRPIRVNYKTIISTALTLLILFFIYRFFSRNRELFASLRNLTWLQIMVIAVIQPITVILVALTNKLILDKMGLKIKLWEYLSLQFVNNMLNKFVAEAGALYRGAYLKANHTFSFSDFIASVGGGYIITLFVSSIAGILTAIIIWLKTGMMNKLILSGFCLVLLATISLIVIPIKLADNNWLFIRINRVLTGWNLIKGDSTILVKIFFLILSALILQSIAILVAFRGIHAQIGLFNSVFYSAASTLANFINITPGGLGITEGVLLASASIIGLSMEVILLGALLVRAVNLTMSVITGCIGYLAVLIVPSYLNRRQVNGAINDH